MLPPPPTPMLSMDPQLILRLIAAAIHMFFDCLALGMGLFASVMATWPSNSVYTYGRVLSPAILSSVLFGTD